MRRRIARASCHRASGERDARCTTRFENAHKIVLREVLYRHHRWYGRKVYIHETIDKAGGVVFRCSLDGSKADRFLEVPA
jgi:hypothetical protein